MQKYLINNSKKTNISQQEKYIEKFTKKNDNIHIYLAKPSKKASPNSGGDELPFLSDFVFLIYVDLTVRILYYLVNNYLGKP